MLEEIKEHNEFESLKKKPSINQEDLNRAEKAFIKLASQQKIAQLFVTQYEEYSPEVKVAFVAMLAQVTHGCFNAACEEVIEEELNASSSV